MPPVALRHLDYRKELALLESKWRYALLLGVLSMTVAMQGGPVVADDESLPPFPKDIVGSREYIEIGKQVFDKRCKFCHGKGVYPGKAPQLDPSRYTPEFIFDRVTNGYKSMPPWSSVFSIKERQGVTAYILSKEFETHP